MYEAYEECMKRLEASMPAYLKKVGSFIWDNKSWKISKHYILDFACEKCQVCGHYPLKEIFEITTVKGETIIVGNRCINNITSEPVAAWYKNHRRYAANLLKHKIDIHNINGILKVWLKTGLPCITERKDFESFERMLVRLCRGWNLTKDQNETYKCYYKKLEKFAMKSVTESV